MDSLFSPAQSRQEIQRLFDVEYGDSIEVLVRMCGVALGGATLFFVTGWMMAWVWSALFLLSHGVYYWFLRTRRMKATASDLMIASGMFTLVALSFLWIPAYMAGLDDPALSFSGYMLVATTFVFLIRKADGLIAMIWGEIVIVMVTVLWIMSAQMQKMDGALERIGLVAVAATICAYMARALKAARRLRLDGEAAAEKVAQEQKMAAIGQLAGGVAHDFNNVLTAIGGNLELYDHLHDPKEKDQVVTEARKASERAANVVRQLLIYARKAPIQSSLTDVNESILQMRDLSRSLVPQSVHIDLVLTERGAMTHVDPNQLITAMINIVVNAIDAMQNGGRLWVSSELVSLDAPINLIDGSDLPVGDYVKLSFRDTGTGIPAKHLTKIIEPFFTTKAPGKGTGLGLSMILGFARNAGGGLDITSTPNGATIVLFLPAAQAEPQTQNAAPQGSGASYSVESKA